MAERLLPRSAAAFLAVEAPLYAAFLFLDLTGRGGRTIPIKYAGILLCLAFALLWATRGGDRLVPAALALTAAADWFLLVRGDHLVLGVVLFLGVQGIYLVRLRRAGAGSAWPLRAGLAGAAGLAVWALGLAAALELLAAVYYAQLLVNAALSWTLPGHRWRRSALGLTLFAGCDLCVGLFNAPVTDPVLYHAVSVGMWLFYLPSQVLIALSALPEKEEAHENHQ